MYFCLLLVIFLWDFVLLAHTFLCVIQKMGGALLVMFFCEMISEVNRIDLRLKLCI